ncbi:hypothetical protein DIPPA_25754 [Diplonema papillatum]|nr:hypothetical protein DIPPA_25754 [Diplonema papillatum]KAJ9461433.1 hypothetical protein DIPPA_25754 [Diplonema papillatum]KAJ9461434.1 hypothetical protein DIPPA_25754 [Diplonema papillatum]
MDAPTVRLAGGFATVDVEVTPTYRDLALPVCQLLHIISRARWSILETGWLGLAEARTRGEIVFVGTQQLELTTALATLERGAPEISGGGLAGSCTMRVAKVGSKSFTIEATLSMKAKRRSNEAGSDGVDPPAQRLVCRNEATYVFVEKASGKTMAIPAVVRPLLQSSADASSSDPAACLGLPQVPETLREAVAFKFTTSVRPSDTDWNGHMNNSRFLTFVTDAVETHFVGMREPRIVNTVVRYVKELKAGDPVVVSCAVQEAVDELPEDATHPRLEKVEFSVASTDGGVTYASGHLWMLPHHARFKAAAAED